MRLPPHWWHHTEYRVEPRSVAVLFARTGEIPVPGESLLKQMSRLTFGVSANQPG